MSTSSLFQPVETRIAPSLSPGELPMAASTWERSTFPDEQAEPEEHSDALEIEGD